MANKIVYLPIARVGGTLRKDAWWAGPTVTVLALSGFVAYATWRTFEGAAYTWEAYLSPFYSPLFDVGWARSLGLGFFTPAMLILPAPLSFRFTCYYYRKAYYRAFAWDPPACAVGERAPHRYHGETRLLLFQNLHRFALYLAIVVLVVLWKDVVLAVVGWRDGAHVGVGTLVMIVNVVLITGYTCGCHSFRHLVGGGVNSYSSATLGAARHALWRLVTFFNERHQLFAWASLLSVGLTDLYIRMVATGHLTDVRIF
ncbi:MAG TPA: hypothetical protein VE987_14910 [Polyangiaceae bacterium]|nr:hypothetical protein [Polyangiaceae bacterium]